MAWDDRPEDDGWFSVDPKGHREPEEDERPTRRGPSFLTVLLGLVVVAIAVVAWLNRSSEDRATVTPSPTTTTTPTTPTPSDSLTPTPDTSQSVTTSPGRRAPLGPTTPWNLYALVGSQIVRVEMATGRTTTLRTPLLGEEGTPMAIVPLPGRVLVQAAYGAGTNAFFVSDADFSARSSTGGGFTAGLTFAALGTQRLWFSRTDDNVNRLDLLDLAATPVRGGSVTLPGDLFADSARSDGGLAVLVDGIDGAYRVEGAAIRRITTGILIARSDAGWLVSECDDEHRCALSFVDRRTLARRALGPFLGSQYQGGSISPDGRRAVVVEATESSSQAHVIDLVTGTRRPVARVTPSYGPGGNSANVVWSPDSRWLVLVTDTGTVAGVDLSSTRLVPLDLGLVSGQATLAARY